MLSVPWSRGQATLSSPPEQTTNEKRGRTPCSNPHAGNQQRSAIGKLPPVTVTALVLFPILRVIAGGRMPLAIGLQGCWFNAPFSGRCACNSLSE